MKSKIRGLYRFVGIVIGASLTAAALNWFMVPNALAGGGVTGIGIILYHVAHIPVGLSVLLINIPLFIIGTMVLGREFGAKTILGTLALALAVDVLAPYTKALTGDLILAAVYGGALSGLGLGIAFRCGGSTGGTDIASRIISSYTNLTTGQALLLIDFLVIAGVALIFDAETALYALLTLFVSSKVIDGVQEGIGYAKAALIISDSPEQIANAVFQELDRGVTYLSGMGGYTKEERQVLVCVVSRMEVTPLKQIVHDIDEDAFVVIGDVREVLGEGFTHPTKT